MATTNNATTQPTDIEMFAGGGGMAVGLKEAGFSPASFYELDKRSCETLRHNAASKSPTLIGKIIEGKAEEIDWGDLRKPVRLLAAGAPCQPFSLAGKHLAERDGRNLFPEVFRAVRQLRPFAVFLENVRGLARESFRPYFDYIIRQLQCPSVAPHRDELWQDHDARIRRYQLSVGFEPEYRVDYRLLDAADFGAPQNRKRVLIVATRSDFPVYEFPKTTHGKSELLRIQVFGDYWDRHEIRKPKGFTVGKESVGEKNGKLPWLTVRDALKDLPEAAENEENASMNHWQIPGARRYPGHTGSVLDWPAKTIKAGVHGVPGGENTVVEDNGEFRYFTLRETARLQTFPDNHLFLGARIHVTRQIGNAVPCLLAATLARPLYKLIQHELKRRSNHANPE